MQALLDAAAQGTVGGMAKVKENFNENAALRNCCSCNWKVKWNYMQNYKNMVASNWMKSAQKTQRKTIDGAKWKTRKTKNKTKNKSKRCMETKREMQKYSLCKG